MNLYDVLGQDKTKRTTTSSSKVSLGKQIANELYDVCHEYLRKNYPNNFMDISGTQIVKTNTRTKKSEVHTINGEKLLFPLDESVEVTHAESGKTLTMDNPCSINELKIYAEGKNSQLGEYIQIGGKVHTWNGKKFTETKAK